MGRWEWVEDSALGALFILIMPFCLLVVSIMFLVYSGVYFHWGAEKNEKIKQNAIIEKIATNPGERYYEWGELWGVQATTWAELEDDFAPVQEDWASRGLEVDWNFMTDSFDDARFMYGNDVTFSEYTDELLGNDEHLGNMLCTYGNPDLETTGISFDTKAGIVLLVLGIITFPLSVFWIYKKFFS